MRVQPLVLAAPLLCAMAFRGRATEELPEAPDFDREVLPALEANCFRCHGPKRQRSGLRLDRRADALLGGDSNRPAIVPGASAESELIRRISSEDEDEWMPADDDRLSEETIDLLTRWIDGGAEWGAAESAGPETQAGSTPEHWAYLAPERAPAPAVSEQGWDRNPLDPFVLARLEAEGIEHAPEADRTTLIRRLSLDLTGLPPASEEVQAFVADERPDAYEALVDRLLASPHYGERMAMHWLDLVRYADTTGFHGDNYRDVWPYRDYVIEALNENKPFDVFTIEQLAGDLLEDAGIEARIASGYNRLNQTTAETGAQAGEYLARYASDRVRTTSSTWLGATLGCAECHDHKFDPYASEDFYSFAAFFADIKERGVYYPVGVPLPDEEQAAELKRLEVAIALRSAELNTPRAEIQQAQAAWEEQMRARLPSSPILLGTWHSSEPYPVSASEEAHEQAFPPELPQGSEEALEWVVRNDLIDGEAAFFGQRGTVTYLRRIVEVDSDGPVAFTLNAPNAAKIWINAEMVHSVAKGEVAGRSPIDVELRQGQNVFLLKTVNMAGSFATTLTFDLLALGLPDEISAILREPEERDDSAVAPLASHYRSVTPLLEAKREEIAVLQQQRAALLGSVSRTLMSESVEPRTVRVLPRGNWMDDSGAVVTPDVPGFLPPLSVDGERASRLDLARWVVSRDNPLTARVFVNRLWKLFFGRGICRTLDDLGSRGDLPTHPELLDWLAVEFMSSGWDIKHMVKLIVTSRTYRQSSRPRDELADRDPYNTLLARQSSFRLEAELVRDNALAVAGLLSRRVGGPSVKPYQPEGYWDHLNFPPRAYENDHGEDLYRRGLYTFWMRSFLHPSLLAFDAPSREESTVEREISNTPQQALVLLNDPTFVEAARVFAERIIAEGGSDSRTRLGWAYREALSRDVAPREAAILLELLEEHLDTFRAHQDDAQRYTQIGDKAVPSDVDRAELAAWTSVARTILSLHEFITRS